MRPFAGVLLLCLAATHQAAKAETSMTVPAPQATPSAAPPAVVTPAESPSAELPAEAPAAPAAVDLNFSNLQRRLAARLARPSYAARSRFGPPAVETEGFGVQVERNCGEAKRTGR